MKHRALPAILFCAVAAGPASADAPNVPPPVDPVTPPPAASPMPTPTPTPAPTPTPTPMPTPATGSDERPSGLSIGIGVGYQFPTSLETPNITSVRFRLANGMTFEPQLFLANTTDTVDTGTPIDTKHSELGLGTVLRYPLATRGRADLELLGTIRIDNLKDNPDGADDETSTTNATVAYGIAVTSWITKHWQISLSSSNPILAFARTRQEMGPMNVLVQSSTTLGAIFNPTVILMVHLYH